MKRKRNIKFIIGIPLLILLTGLLTFIALNKLAPQNEEATKTPAVVAPKPSEIVKKIQVSGAVAELLNLYTKLDQASVGLNTMSYTKTESYTTFVTASDFVQLSQNDTSQPKNSVTVKANIEAYLAKNNLNKVAAKNSLYTIFDSDQTVCQLVDLPSMGKQGATLGLGCIEKSTISKQYTTIDRLLSLDTDRTVSSLHAASIRLTTITEDDKTLSTLDVYATNGSAVTLIFAAIGKNWEYIGERPLTTGTTESNMAGIDRALSGELIKKINDAKYQGFLVRHIQ